MNTTVTSPQINILLNAVAGTKDWLSKRPLSHKHRKELEVQLQELENELRHEIDLAERKAITDRWDARIAAGQNIIMG